MYRDDCTQVSLLEEDPTTAYAMNRGSTVFTYLQGLHGVDPGPEPGVRANETGEEAVRTEDHEFEGVILLPSLAERNTYHR